MEGPDHTYIEGPGENETGGLDQIDREDLNQSEIADSNLHTNVHIRLT